MDKPVQGFVTVQQATALWSQKSSDDGERRPLSSQCLYRMLQNGQIKGASKDPEGCWQIPAEQLDETFERCAPQRAEGDGFDAIAQNMGPGAGLSVLDIESVMLSALGPLVDVISAQQQTLNAAIESPGADQWRERHDAVARKLDSVVVAQRDTETRAVRSEVKLESANQRLDAMQDQLAKAERRSADLSDELDQQTAAGQETRTRLTLAVSMIGRMRRRKYERLTGPKRNRPT